MLSFIRLALRRPYTAAIAALHRLGGAIQAPARASLPAESAPAAPDDPVGGSPAFAQVLKLAGAAARVTSTVLVTVEGDIDAANHRALGLYVERQTAGSTRLVLDLANVDFFGTAGFATLHNINVICSRSGVSWLLLVGPQFVDRGALAVDAQGLEAWLRRAHG